jgi:hypothetical protein
MAQASPVQPLPPRNLFVQHFRNPAQLMPIDATVVVSQVSRAPPIRYTIYDWDERTAKCRRPEKPMVILAYDADHLFYPTWLEAAEAAEAHDLYPNWHAVVRELWVSRLLEELPVWNVEEQRVDVLHAGDSAPPKFVPCLILYTQPVSVPVAGFDPIQPARRWYSTAHEHSVTPAKRSCSITSSSTHVADDEDDDNDGFEAVANGTVEAPHDIVSNPVSLDRLPFACVQFEKGLTRARHTEDVTMSLYVPDLFAILTTTSGYHALSSLEIMLRLQEKGGLSYTEAFPGKAAYLLRLECIEKALDRVYTLGDMTQPVTIPLDTFAPFHADRNMCYNDPEDILYQLYGTRLAETAHQCGVSSIRVYPHLALLEQHASPFFTVDASFFAQHFALLRCFVGSVGTRVPTPPLSLVSLSV